MIGSNHGVSGERIKLNQHISQDKLSNYSGVNYGPPLNEGQRGSD